jgi:hypothetical protein
MSSTNNNKVEIVVTCPHCDMPVLIEQLNCKIFRHATLVSNNTQINPHASKEECDHYIKNNLIYGCGKPFQVVENSDGTHLAVVCEYI